MEICKFTRSQSVSEIKAGGKLMMYDGMISGIYIDIIKNKNLTM